MVLEVHIIGSIRGYSYFSKREIGGFQCRYQFESGIKTNQSDNKKTINDGDEWHLVDGQNSGETQFHILATPEFIEGENILEGVWDHPIDVHYVSSGVIGWPRIHLEVWKLDDCNSRNIFFGSGSCHCPPPGGTKDFDLVLKRPRSTSFIGRLESFFLGRISSGDGFCRKGTDKRFTAESVGIVYLSMNAIAICH